MFREHKTVLKSSYQMGPIFPIHYTENTYKIEFFFLNKLIKLVFGGYSFIATFFLCFNKSFQVLLIRNGQCIDY